MYTIKEISNQLRLSIDTLRYYDQMGIVSPIRNANNYRSYSEEDILRLQYVSVMKYANFSINEIKIMIELLSSEPSQECKKKSIELLRNKAIEMQRLIANYSNLLTLLDESIEISQNIESFPESQYQVDDFIIKLFHDFRD